MKIQIKMHCAVAKRWKLRKNISLEEKSFQTDEMKGLNRIQN